MFAASTLITSVLAFWLLTCVVVGICARKINHFYPSLALLVGGLAMVASAVMGWNNDYVWTVPTPIYLALMPLELRIDTLSSLFVGLLGSVTIAVSFFSPAYLRQLPETSNNACYWLEMFLFISGMLGVILSANALSFLLWWEIMVLSSLLLIATRLTSGESRKAAFVALATSRITTALLIAGFIWMHLITNSWELTSWKFSAHESSIPALLILLGLIIQTGLFPFHTWLPLAHPEAPVPVSALMSGVMIEVAFYAIMRILIMEGLISPYIAYLMLGLGIISAFWGAFRAFFQRDIKILLAYSSIENAGLVMVALGVCVLGFNLQLPVVSSLGLAGAIYQCINHGISKSLLFLGAGSIESRAITRNLDECGGLGQRRPWTMGCFILGAAAICSLPPLNGFASIWLVYQSLFQLASMSNQVWLAGLSVLTIGILGLTSGIRVATFARATGSAFLGTPASETSLNASEGGLNMRASQIILVALCLILGLAAPGALDIIKPICLAARTGGITHFPIPMGVFATGIGIFTSFLYFFWLNSGKPSVKNLVPWESGSRALPDDTQLNSVGLTGHFARRVPSQSKSSAAKANTPTKKIMIDLASGGVFLYLVYVLVAVVALVLIEMNP